MRNRQSIFDDEFLQKQLDMQKRLNWDLETDIPWGPVDLNKHLVPLDDNALLFPGAAKEQRLVISQMMGLVMASAICEMEESLMRLKHKGFNKLIQDYPVNPEFEALGEQFFEEEAKHSESFRRFINQFCVDMGLDPVELRSVLPLVEQTKTEWFLEKNLASGGAAFWWLIAEVEQEFIYLYHAMRPFVEELEPLHFMIHKRHFEEEARHANFPHLFLKLISERYEDGLIGALRKTDLVLAQGLKLTWSAATFERMARVRKKRDTHEFYRVLSDSMPMIKQQNLFGLSWNLLVKTPYIASFINPRYHNKFTNIIEELGVWTLPFPKPNPATLRSEAI